MTCRLSVPSAVLAASFLLAAFPVLADDLLDAVLWDGPSAFPSKSTPANEPPPVAEPAPAPRPAAPAAGTARQAVPQASAPAPRPSASDPVLAVPSDSPVAAPPSATPPSSAQTASDPVPGEAQIRHEIQEMRARADRLEAALGPAAPPPSPRPPYDRADWPKRARLALNAFYNAGREENGGVGEFAFPVAETSFDVAMRIHYYYSAPETKHGYLSSNRHSVFREEKEVLGATVWGIWYPWRNAVVSPHVGVGGGYETTTGSKDYWEYRGSRSWNAENGWYEDLEDNGLTLAGRVGATLTYKRFTLKGEFILTSETKVFVGEAGLRIWEHLVLNAVVERYDLDLSDPSTTGGGGITILF